MSYLVIKALHVIGVVAWFAGLFYIFRLFVYHTENREKPEICSLLQVMERRLYFAIMYPAMIFTTIMGSLMVWQLPELLAARWFQIKLFALVFLFAYHFYAGYVRKKFANQDFILSSKQCRMINELPTLILIIVVVMVIVRPFA